MWPNSPYWKALADNDNFEVNGLAFKLKVVDCGILSVESSRIVICDPFIYMRIAGNHFVRVPPGDHQVRATLATVTDANGQSASRPAYLTVIVGEEAEAERRVLDPKRDDEDLPPNEPGAYHGFEVESGTACVVDEEALAGGMPAEETWADDLFKPPGGWFEKLDADSDPAAGVASIKLPLTQEEKRLVLCVSGWGNGTFPVVGGYDNDDKLVAVHLDFCLIPDPNNDA